MLDVAHMGLHVAQMTGVDQMKACFDAVTRAPARILGTGTGELAEGGPADLVVLEAGDPVEALRLRARRRIVVRGGKIVASAPPGASNLDLPGRPPNVDFRRRVPSAN
jgi:cytosine deaminase